MNNNLSKDTSGSLNVKDQELNYIRLSCNNHDTENLEEID